MENHTSNQLSDQAPLSLANFISFPYQSHKGIPVTQFAAGSPFSLKWDSNGTTFNLYANGNQTPLYTGAATSTDLQQGFQCNTTLMLEADNGAEKLYAFLTIIISSPELTPYTISQTSGVMTNSGTLTVDGILYNKTLTFGSTGVLNLGDNDSLEDLTVSQSVNITGATSVNSLTTPGTSNINSLTVTNNMTAGDATIAMIGKGHLLKLGTSFGEMDVTAKTDGFAMILIDPRKSDSNVYSYCNITYGDQQYSINGVLLEEDSTMDIPKFGYCCIPIRSSSTWSCTGTVTGVGTAPLIFIYWIPLGGGDDSYTIQGEKKEMADMPPPAKRSDPRALSAQLYTDFLQTLAEAMQKNPAPATAFAQKIVRP